MTLRSEWAAIVARIDGFLASTNVYLQSLIAERGDAFKGADQVLLPESRKIFGELGAFANRYEESLSPAAKDALHRFLEDNKDHFGPPLQGWHLIKRVAPALAAVRHEISFHLADSAAYARRLSERAFEHLQRSIVVDEEVRSKWKLAFRKGEVACERLGAIHLLSHGIWAFKINAAGERTDLVFADRPIEQTEVESVAEALVLTEWKKVLSPEKRDAQASQARAQASRYSVGSLAGIELASYRYVVLVSGQHLERIPDERVGEIIYRHVNVAVDPRIPSRDRGASTPTARRRRR
jgi:hypothetical protein